jgi:hypothetical protein
VAATLDLAVSPLLATAMDILALNSAWVDTLHLCRLLRSPFIAGALSEESGRAHLERRLRDTGELKVQLAWVRELAAETLRRFIRNSNEKRTGAVFAVSIPRPASLRGRFFSNRGS